MIIQKKKTIEERKSGTNVFFLDSFIRQPIILMFKYTHAHAHAHAHTHTHNKQQNAKHTQNAAYQKHIG